MTDNRPRVALMPDGLVEAWLPPRYDQDHLAITCVYYVALDPATGEIAGSTAPQHTAEFAALYAAARAYLDQLKR